MNRKWIVVFVVLVVFGIMTSCNLPIDDILVSGDNQIATTVALTLQPQLSEQDIIATNVQATVQTANGVVAQGNLSEQDIIATTVASTLQASGVNNPPATNSPADTAVPIMPTNTPMPTPTLSSSPTPTLEPTPTLSSLDPVASLGNPSWADEFKPGQSNWRDFSNAHYEALFNNGAYQMKKYNTSYTELWYVSAKKAKTFYLDIEVLTGDVCQGKDRYGVLFRAPDLLQGLILTFSCDGSYRFSYWDKVNYEEIISWTFSNEIKAGANQLNRIGIRAEGTLFKFYANGVFLGEASTAKYQANGRIGLLIAASETENFYVRYDNLKVWNLP